MAIAIDVPSRPRAASTRLNGRRVLLVAGTLAGVTLATALGAGVGSSDADPDLLRLMQFMALLKGGFAVMALGACFWRLARPAAAWREMVYVAGPGVMAAGAVCLWQLQWTGLAAAGLHIGMFALLGAALTDEAFIPAFKARRRSSEARASTS